MGIFGNKQVTKAAISPATVNAQPEAPKVQAAVGVGGVNSIGQYYQYHEGTARNRAMSLATVSRSRDLLASVIACMPLQMYNEVYNDSTGEMEQVNIAPRSWLRQPDPTVTYNFLMAWTLDDLLFYGRAFWYISSRTTDGFPASFTRIPAGSVTTPDQNEGPVFFGISNDIGGTDTNLNLTKLRTAKRYLDKNNVPADGRCFLVSAAGLESLLGETAITSADFNSVKALVNGEIDTFLGFKFTMIGDRSEGGLAIDASLDRVCFAYHRDAVGFGIGMNMKTEINYVPEKTSYLVNGMFSAGAIAIDDEGIVKITCRETA